mmetsp:Transcript_9961/g.17072  ORF Transcript_9961/g.17072 Transcript_9961/m.17072 type:complete len:754 (+) Transcript_9961:37-2298(+)|eukprot:CAMPEP_0184703626 /NCGR_PEP_ID=MMETSP0313-20130426/28471_1 /TAXON_ID=2792 /ORGANISM="Porphyridium aerugineum, Strain SAG 1380-2" /LENGTH=753 /DNA_ID=CAMNT_0027164441 /DNA_START=29 /DNA_END=2290 /DNA_ORIENTATION=+
MNPNRDDYQEIGDNGAIRLRTTFGRRSWALGLYSLISLTVLCVILYAAMWPSQNLQSWRLDIKASPKVGSTNWVQRWKALRGSFDAKIREAVKIVGTKDVVATHNGKWFHTSERDRNIRDYPDHFDNFSWPQFYWSRIGEAEDELPTFAAEQAKTNPLTWCSENYGAQIFSLVDGDFKGAALGDYMYSGFQYTDMSYVDGVYFMSVQTPHYNSEVDANSIPERVVFIHDTKLMRGWMYITSGYHCEMYTMTESSQRASCNDIPETNYRFKFVNKTESEHPYCVTKGGSGKMGIADFKREGKKHTRGMSKARMNRVEHGLDPDHVVCDPTRNITVSVEAWKWTSPGATQEHYVRSPKGTVLDLALIRLEHSNHVYPLVHSLEYHPFKDDEMVYDFITTRFRPVDPENYKLPLVCRGKRMQDLDEIMADYLGSLPHDSNSTTSAGSSPRSSPGFSPGSPPAYKPKSKANVDANVEANVDAVHAAHRRRAAHKVHGDQPKRNPNDYYYYYYDGDDSHSDGGKGNGNDGLDDHDYYYYGDPTKGPHSRRDRGMESADGGMDQANVWPYSDDPYDDPSGNYDGDDQAEDSAAPDASLSTDEDGNENESENENEDQSEPEETEEPGEDETSPWDSIRRNAQRDAHYTGGKSKHYMADRNANMKTSKRKMPKHPIPVNQGSVKLSSRKKLDRKSKRNDESRNKVPKMPKHPIPERNHLRIVKRRYIAKHCPSGRCDAEVWKQLRNHPCPYMRLVARVPLL